MQKQEATLHELLKQKVYDVETFLKSDEEEIKSLNETIVQPHEAREK